MNGKSDLACGLADDFDGDAGGVGYALGGVGAISKPSGARRRSPVYL
jgi:hypothetical protein